MNVSCEFEKSVLNSLECLLSECGTTPAAIKNLGVAVSGGADSLSLLCSLYEIFPPQLRTKLKAVTVDHSMRENGAGADDAAFVRDFCRERGIECFVKKIPEGAVCALSAERGRGLEEAARFLRYKAFEEFAAQSGCEYICLAHNKNDALETLLMRFLQGSCAPGTAPVRGIFLRPLLKTDRAEIEEYLNIKNIVWRTDATNCDNDYLRNKIRNLLVPFLNRNFGGWQKSVLAGGEKIYLQNEALEKFLESFTGTSESSGAEKSGCSGKSGIGNSGSCRNSGREYSEKVSDTEGFDAALFEKLPQALRHKLLYGAFEKLGVSERIPYSFVRTLGFWPEQDFGNLRSGSVCAFTEKNKLFLKIFKKQATESAFFDIIEKEGFFEFEDFSLEVSSSGEILVRAEKSLPLKASLPFAVRNREEGDGVLTFGGAKKSLADIFSDWKVPENLRDRIPVLENGGGIFAVLGFVYGFDNWIVHDIKKTGSIK